MIELLGHLHPVLVHLPIGIIVAGLLLQWLVQKPRYAAAKAILAPVFLIGTVTALLSSITGYLLSLSDDYEQSLVNWHLWSAIALIITSAILYTKHANPQVAVGKNWMALAVLFFVALTGHLGGSLTHGSDYLSRPFASFWQGDTLSAAAIPSIPNVQEAAAYHDVIQPVLQAKCYSCHNAGKQKGGLRMDEYPLLMKGGKNGAIINYAHADSSEMLRRILLPADHEDHMPPKEKLQPTENQVALLRWWIGTGASPVKKVKELEQTERIQPMLAALQQPVLQQKADAAIPQKAVEPANAKVLQELRASGIAVLPVARNSNYLSVSFGEEVSTVTLAQLEALQKIDKQLIWLKLTQKQLPATGLTRLAHLTQLTRLNLAYATFNQQELPSLTRLQQLSYLNLVGTPVTHQSLVGLSSLKHLQSLYLYQTGVNRSEYNTLRNMFPKTLIDTGNYVVPLLASDTTLVKAGASR